MKRTANQFFHVYILRSEKDPHMVKVGKANNLKRVPYFSEAGYAGITDWIQVVTVLADSDAHAYALESMINAKLVNQGHKRGKIMWNDLKVPGRRVGADECYDCHVDHAVQISLDMADLYLNYIA